MNRLITYFLGIFLKLISYNKLNYEYWHHMKLIILIIKIKIPLRFRTGVFEFEIHYLIQLHNNIRLYILKHIFYCYFFIIWKMLLALNENSFRMWKTPKKFSLSKFFLKTSILNFYSASEFYNFLYSVINAPNLISRTLVSDEVIILKVAAAATKVIIAIVFILFINYYSI